MKVLVFDTSVISAFARAGLLDTLERITSGHERVVTRAVVDELERGRSSWPELAAAVGASWLQRVSVDTLRELTVFAECSRRLGTAFRNVGECSTLAWAEAHDAVAVTDDQVAYDLGRERGIDVCRSLRLLATALQSGILVETEAEKAVDLLLAKGARLPFRSGAEFLHWFRNRKGG